MSEPLYTLEILRLASEIPHLGLIDDPEGTADLRSPACGSRMQVTVGLDGEGRVCEIGQTVTACAFGQASAALMGASAIGRSRSEVEGALTEITKWLSGARDDPGTWRGLLYFTAHDDGFSLPYRRYCIGSRKIKRRRGEFPLAVVLRCRVANRQRHLPVACPARVSEGRVDGCGSSRVALPRAVLHDALI